jgi:hypothetical protein
VIRAIFACLSLFSGKKARNLEVRLPICGEWRGSAVIFRQLLAMMRNPSAQ